MGTPQGSASSAVTFNGSSATRSPGTAVASDSAGGAFGLQPVAESGASPGSQELTFVAARWPIELHADEISANSSTLLGQNVTGIAANASSDTGNDTVFTAPAGSRPRTTLTVSVDAIEQDSGDVVQPDSFGLQSRVFLPIDIEILAAELQLQIVNEDLEEIPLVGARPNVTIERNASDTVVPQYTVVRCEFWDEEAAGGQGSWETRGCKPDYVDLDIGALACLCGHHTDIKGRMQQLGSD